MGGLDIAVAAESGAPCTTSFRTRGILVETSGTPLWVGSLAESGGMGGALKLALSLWTSQKVISAVVEGHL